MAVLMHISGIVTYLLWSSALQRTARIIHTRQRPSKRRNSAPTGYIKLSTLQYTSYCC